jgi:hypothetical protein
MPEVFSDYKKIIENNLVNVPFLFAGDVISSHLKSFNCQRDQEHMSPMFVIDCFDEIYRQSFYEMVSKSKEIIISSESISNVYQSLTSLGINTKFIFSTNKFSRYIGTHFKVVNHRAFPPHFYAIEKIFGLDIDILNSPLITELEDEIVIYVTDKPIQSLVYTIQNMDYVIKKISRKKWSHVINYPFYDCVYNSYKVVIRDISKIRENKIKDLLDGN